MVGPHQERAVGPFGDEVAVVPPALDHHVGEAERQRPIGSGPHPQPDIGLAGETDPARIDAIGPLVGEILARAAAADEPPQVTAENMAKACLAAAPDEPYLPARPDRPERR